MTSYDDTKVQLTINRMTEECYENVPDKSSTELYLISQDPTSIAKIDLDAQSRTDAEISSIQSDMNALQSNLNALSSEVSTLSEWTTTQIDDLIGDVQEVSSQTAQNTQDIADISANLTHSTVRRWEYVEYKGLTFTAEEANSTVAMQKVGSAPDVSLEYSTGDGWNDFIVGTTTVTLANVGDQMVLRAKTTNSGMGSGTSTYNKFVMTGKIAASDSIMYLLKNDGDLDTMSSDYCFCYLFNDCTSLTSAPELPATTLVWNCYTRMFYGCTSLTETPELPATTMVGYCYSGMFMNCTNLTSAPELPATTLASNCYYRMFEGCTSLTQAPELPATTMQWYCYSAMFRGCTSLTQTPELPATALSLNCYDNMFNGCTSITTPPELPATTLAQGCYANMFKGCASLTFAPELPATTLPEYCYWGMFNDCSSLNEIKIAYTGNFSGTGVPSNAFSNWVNGVSASGKFYYDGEDTTTGASAIPTGWEVREITLPGLTFTAEEANSTVSMTRPSSFRPAIPSLEYTTDGKSWTDFEVGTTTVTLTNVGDKMAMRAKTTNTYPFYDSWNNTAVKFVMTGKIAASNSVMYLLKNDGDLDTIPSAHQFDTLFNGISALTTPPTLPATTLVEGCYNSMFQSCTSLTSAPKLPATTLMQECYYNMFRDCTSLTQAPELPATTLANQCYGYMFQHCASLTQAPVLPATTLANQCYTWMFSDCTSLTTAPELPATTLASNCYNGMFYNCTSLTTAPYLPATTLANQCYAWMFYGCSSLNEIKIGYTGNFSTTYFSNWVSRVAASGTFYYNGSDTTRGNSAIPTNWTVQSF